MSSAGLVWKYFGKQILKGFDESVHEKMYQSLFLEIDAIDNGIAQSLTYPIKTNLSNRVNRLNLNWND